MYRTEYHAVQASGLARDTIDLESDPAFTDALAKLSINRQHLVVAEVRSVFGNGSTRDSLLLPSVQTSRPFSTIVREQLRFRFPIDSSVVLSQLLDTMRTFLQLPRAKLARISVLQPTQVSSAKEATLAKVVATMGEAARMAEYRLIADAHDAIEVVLDF